MNREPPKNVYSNNRLRKTAPAADQTSSRHPQPTSISTNNHTRVTHFHLTKLLVGYEIDGLFTNVLWNQQVVNKPQDVKVERSLHFNKSQSKYEKHLEPNAPTNKTLVNFVRAYLG